MQAFVVSEVEGSLSLGVRDVAQRELAEGDVRVRVEYSGVNYKDAMVASAPSRVRRVASLIGGVDASGIVESSNDVTWHEGERVAVHGGLLGVARDGGFAPYVDVPSDYLSLLAPSLSTRDAMIIGTAGFSAMASVLALEDHGLAAGGRVLVTGASGGVGSQSLTYLAQRGYHPVASSGSPKSSKWLLDRGAREVIGRRDISDRPDRVLATERWDGAVDCVGGATLREILRSLKYGAAVAASGLVESAALETTLYPFITRSVALLGVDAVDATRSTRERVWSALGDAASSVDFTSFLDREIALEELPQAFLDVRAGSTRGRVLVTLRKVDATA